MDSNNSGTGVIPPGIIIQHPGTATTRPAISAFIWGGQVAPVPSLPYGRSKA